MVYCVAFGCNSNSCSGENISFFRFPADAAHAAGKRKNEMFSLTTVYNYNTITTKRNTVNHYNKIYCVFETLTDK